MATVTIEQVLGVFLGQDQLQKIPGCPVKQVLNSKVRNKHRICMIQKGMVSPDELMFCQSSATTHYYLELSPLEFLAKTAKNPC